MSERFTPAYWRERAEESRAMAEEMKDLGARRILVDIAESYDRMADRAEAGSGRAKPKEDVSA